MKESILVALTGGIASGKSTALENLKKQGVNTLSADETYKNLLKQDCFVKRIAKQMGVDTVEIDGKLAICKEQLANKVFTNKENLFKLNSITHPIIMQTMIDEAKSHGGISVIEVPLLFEGKFEGLFDKIIVVIRNDKDRIKSAVERDGKTENQIINIIKNQTDYSNLVHDNNTIIVHNKEKEILICEVLDIVKAIESEYNRDYNNTSID